MRLGELLLQTRGHVALPWGVEAIPSVALGLAILGASSHRCSVPTALIVVSTMELGLLSARLLAGRLLTLMVTAAEFLGLEEVLGEDKCALLGSLRDRLVMALTCT